MTPDFGKQKKQQSSSDALYDLEFDAVLIEQSIAKQYGILPSQQGELTYSDWSKLVGGLMRDTPLGQVVSIRGETDRNTIQKMNAWQKQIRSEWAAFKAKSQKPGAGYDEASVMAQLKSMLISAFGAQKKQ